MIITKTVNLTPVKALDHQWEKVIKLMGIKNRLVVLINRKIMLRDNRLKRTSQT